MRSMKGADPFPSASIEGAEYNWLIVPRGEQRHALMAPKTKNRRASKFQKKANHAEAYDSLSVDCSFSTIYRKDFERYWEIDARGSHNKVRTARAPILARSLALSRIILCARMA